MKVREYFVKIFDGMAKGLFASLIVGVIINRIGILTGIAEIENIGKMAQYLMGPAIGVGVAFVRKSKQYTLLAAAAAGALGAGTFLLAGGVWAVRVGEPVGALVASLAAVELARLCEGKTKFDLLIVPAVAVIAAGISGIFISPVINSFMALLGNFVNDITVLAPLPMGILLAVVVGMVLTLPVSSAALCISIGISGIAAGAALAGCCAQMVGFAVISFRENKWSGLLSQGLGTSMIQVPNIIKNPLIWIPPTVAGAVCGALSTMVFGMETDMVGAGMGTSGLVGQFTTYAVMGGNSVLPMILLHFVIPAAISLAVAEFMRKKKWIKYGDLLL